MTDETCASTDCCSEIDLRPAAPNRAVQPRVHRQPWLRLRVGAPPRQLLFVRHQHAVDWDYCSSAGATTEATVDDYDDNECVAISSRRRVDCTAASTSGDAEWQTCAAGYERRRGSGALVCD